MTGGKSFRLNVECALGQSTKNSVLMVLGVYYTVLFVVDVVFLVKLQFIFD